MAGTGAGAALFVHVTVDGAVYVLPADGRDAWVTLEELDHHLRVADDADQRILVASAGVSAVADAVVRRVFDRARGVEPVAGGLLPPPTGVAGSTMLMYFAWVGASRLVGDLLARGASVGAADEQGYTALHYAAAEGHHEVVTQLLDAGADAEHVNAHGNRALHLAAATGRLDAVRALVDAGVDLDARAQLGNTALTAAAAGRYDDVVAVLRAAGADPTIVRDDGRGIDDLGVDDGRGIDGL